ncbi:MAG: hypothetical protein H7138_05125 [Myxococcales bacterium]|nr:hypothetical protein [Myxococcales bacterium]
MISSIGSAMAGMASAASRFDRASERIAQPAQDSPSQTGSSDLVRDRAEQITAQHAFAANVTTVRTADEMLGTLIDTIA